jgi:capsular polysaccharide biosynthesis protein
MDQARYAALRGIGCVLYPIVGALGPLRGFEQTTGDYLAGNLGLYHSLDRSEPLCFSEGSKDALLTPQTFVATIPLGRVVFDYGVVITPRNTLLADVSPALGAEPWRHPVLNRMRFSRPLRIQSRVSVISSTAHQRYFHWMFDVLPRFDLLRRSAAKPEFYVVNNEYPFQVQTLAVIGVNQEQIITPSAATHIEAAELIVPSLPGRIGFPTQRSCEFLRKLLLPAESVQPGRRLYITRRDALTRRLLNEAALLERLIRYSFDVVELTSLSVTEQARLFASAQLVVAPHGAGLTNIVFCEKGATVIELMPDDYFNPCFEVVAAHRSLCYTRLIAQTVNPTTHDHVMDVNVVEQIVQGVSQGQEAGRVVNCTSGSPRAS